MDTFSVLDVNFIDNSEDVGEILDHCKRVGKIGIDLESNSMYRYEQEISLMQISVNQTVYLLDIPKIGIPKTLKSILMDNNITKVFQDMQYDMALFEYQFNLQPVNLFDISVGDKLLRMSHQYRSLDKMVNTYLNRSIDTSRTVQRSNWSKRPLSKKQLRYAAKDTGYLVPIMEEIKRQIETDFRLPCLKEYLQNQEPTDLDRKYNIHSMWKIKHINKLDRFQLNLLKQLLLARDKIAQQLNRPIHWIARERLLMQVVLRYKLGFKDFKSIITKYQPKHLRGKIISELYNVYSQKIEPIEDVKKPPHGTSLKKWVTVAPNEKLPFANPEILNEVREWTKLTAENTQLLPEMILSRDNQIKSSLILEERYEGEIIFDGIISEFKSIFRDDFYDYMNGKETKLDFEYLNAIYKTT